MFIASVSGINVMICEESFGSQGRNIQPYG